MASLVRNHDTVEKILRTIEHLRTSFETQTEAFKLAKTRKRNEDLPCNRVPNEMLSMIFTMPLPDWDTPAAVAQGSLIDDYVEFRRAVGMVCSKWTSVLTNTPCAGA